ncbi:MAG: hypothetical protein LBH26_01205, partial [Treponema sp.]|nr:hypothetical protein [Treponema sp.]
MSKKINRAMSLLVILSQVSLLLPAEELRPDLRRGMVRLEHYLDRAALERSAEKWESLAQAGLLAAMAEWESGNLYLREQDLSGWEKDKALAASFYDKERESARARWLAARIYEERAGFESGGLAAELREAARAFTWNSGSGESRIVSFGEGEKARAAWEALGGEIVDRYMAEWEIGSGAAYLELESRLREAGIEGELKESLLKEAGELRRAEALEEYRRIAAAEGNSLMMELLYDRESLKSISGEKAAGLIARELAREAEEAANSSVKALFLKLDTLIAEEDPGDISVSSRDWLSQFRRTFEEGLAKWEAAELGFLAARAGWEREAEQIYLGGEEVWANAYRELEERQLSWENELLQKLDEAYLRWQESGRALEDEIAEAREEFLAAAEENREVRTRMVKIQGDIYTRSRDMMSMAQTAVSDWYERWGYMYENVYIRWQSINNKGEIPSLIHNYLSDLLRTGDISYITGIYGQRIPEILRQYELWKQAYLKIIEYSEDKDEIIDQELLASGESLFERTGGWVVIAGNYRSRADGAVQELYRAAGLDIGRGSAEAYLSELEREYLKALAVEEYWAEERAVAAALNEYSMRNDSGLEVFSRTLGELEEARKSYGEALGLYRDKLGYLDIRSAEIDAAQGSLEEAQAELDRLREIVESMRKNLSKLNAVLLGLQPDTVKLQISEIIAGMLEISAGVIIPGETEEESLTLNGAADSYFSALQAWAEARHMAEIFQILEDLETLHLGETLSAEEKRRRELIRAYLLENGSAGALSGSDLEMMELIVSQYKAYRISEVNAGDREARERVSALIKNYQEREGGPADLSAVMLFASDLQKAGEGLNAAGEEALKAYISGIIQYAALQKIYSPGGLSRPDISAAEGSYRSALAGYESFTNYRNSVYDAELFLKMLGSGDFAAFTPADQDLFAGYAGELAARALNWENPGGSDGGEDPEKKLERVILEMRDREWVKVLLNLQEDLRAKVYRSVISPGGSSFALVRDRLEARVQEKRKIMTEAAFFLEYARFAIQELDLGRFNRMYRLGAFQMDKELPENRLSKEQRENIGEALALDAEDLYLRMEGYINQLGIVFSDEKDWSYHSYNPAAGGSSLAAERNAALEKLKYASGNYALALNAEIAIHKELEESLSLLETMSRNQEDLKTEEKSLKDGLNTAKTNLERYSSGEYTAAIGRLRVSYENYNRAVDAAEESYREMKDARLNLRQRQEIYDWASSVYLDGFGRNEQGEFPLPKEKLSGADYAWERAKVSVEVLAELLQQNRGTGIQYDNALRAYREAGEKYYTALVAAYETDAAVTRQKDVVRKAEAAVEESYRTFAGENSSASLGPGDLVSLRREADGSYRITLGYGAGENREEVCAVYFGERTETVETVDGYREYTRAEIEGREWIEKIFGDPQGIEYFNDIMLAALYLAAQRGGAETEGWFKEAGNPGDDGAYSILDGPNGVYHEVDVSGIYHDSRMSVLAGAYNRVCVEGGEEGREDLARYLLYRERNMIIGGAAAEKDLLEARALGRPADALESKADEKHIIAWAAQGAAAGYFAAASLALAGAGALTQKGLAAQAVAIANFVLEEDYRRAYDRVKSFKNANESLSAGQDQLISGNFETLLERKAELDREQRELYLMLFGEETKPADRSLNRMSYGQFANALNAVFPSPLPGLSIPVDEKQAVSRETALALYHSALYQESGASAGQDIIASLGILNKWLEKGEAGTREKLAAEETRLEDAQRLAADGYRAFLEAEQEIPEEARERLRNYARLAADQSLGLSERNSAALAYDALFAEINPASEDLRRIVRTLAAEAWGAGTWDSRSAFLNLTGFRGGLFNTLVFYSRDNEAYSLKALEDLENAALEVISRGVQSPLEVKEHEWELLREDWKKQYSRWTEQSAEILRLSKSAWEKARERLNEGYYQWGNNFSGEYEAKKAEWELNYLGFVMAKRDWAEEQYLRAGEAGNGETLERLGIKTEEAIGEALAELAILRANRDAPDLSGYLETLLEGTKLPELMAYTGSLGDRAGSALAPPSPGPRRSAEAAALAAAEKALGEMDEDIRKASAGLAAARSLKRLEELKRQILSFVEAGNRDAWEWERKMVTEGGYRIDGTISREVVTDTSLVSVKTERQTVHRYRYYTAPDPYTHVDLSPLAVADLDPETVMFMVAQAEQDINGWGAELLSTRARDGREGKMEAHLGYEPKFKEKPNLNRSALENLQEPGSGEIGLILLDYQWNSMLARRGIAEMAKPVYDQKFWINTTDSILLEPPTVRSVADMGMQMAAAMAMTAASAVTEGSGAAAGMALYFGIDMLDDLLFGVMDAAGGYRDLGDVGKELGRKSLVSAGGAVSGMMAMNGLGIMEKVSASVTRKLGEGFWGSMADTAFKSALGGLRNFADGTARSAFSAAYWDEDRGGLNWSWDLFQEGFEGTLANTASGITGSMASGLLGQLNLGGGGARAAGFTQSQKTDMARMNSFLGDMAANAVSYQMTGSASVNILRYSENFGAKTYSTGLLELEIGDRGLRARLGAGGMDASPGALSSALRGMANWGVSGGSEIAARRDKVKNAATALRSQWGYGDGEAKDLLMSVLSGGVRLAGGSGEAAAETIAGQDGKTILLNQYRDEMSLGEQLFMGLVLQHEAYRDGVLNAGNYLETREAALSHTEMAVRMLLGGESFAGGNLSSNANLVADIT